MWPFYALAGFLYCDDQLCESSGVFLIEVSRLGMILSSLCEEKMKFQIQR